MTPAPAAAVDPTRERAATLAKAREIAALVAQGWSVAAVAVRIGLTERRVRQLMVQAAPDPARDVPDRASVAPAELPRPLKRITRRTLADRALTAMQADRRLATMDRGLRLLWLECVLAIHQFGDIGGIQFGRDGDGFENRAAFVASQGGTEDELNGFLRRGLLVDAPDDGIGLPVNLGLRAWGSEGALRVRRSPSLARAASPRPPKSPVPGQRSFTADGSIRAVGDLPDGNIDGNFLTEDAQVPGNISANNGNFGASWEENSLAPATTTTTEVRCALEELGAASATHAENFRGGENFLQEGLEGRRRGNLWGDGNFQHPEIFQRGLAWLAIELAGPAGVAVPLSPEDLGLVEGWVQEAWRLGLDGGRTEDLLRGVFAAVRGRRGFPESVSLSYFDAPVRDALGKLPRAPPESAA